MLPGWLVAIPVASMKCITLQQKPLLCLYTWSVIPTALLPPDSAFRFFHSKFPAFNCISSCMTGIGNFHTPERSFQSNFDILIFCCTTSICSPVSQRLQLRCVVWVLNCFFITMTLSYQNQDWKVVLVLKWSQQFWYWILFCSEVVLCSGWG